MCIRDSGKGDIRAQGTKFLHRRLQIGVGRQEHKIIALFCTHGGLNIPAYLRQSALPVCIPGAHAPGAQKAQVFLREGALQENAFGEMCIRDSSMPFWG